MARLLDSLKHTFLGKGPACESTAPALEITVKCGKCGEVITARVDKATEVLCEFGDVDDNAEEPPPPVGFTLHKEFLGRNCQNLIRLTIHIDGNRRVTSHEIKGGELVGWRDAN